MHGAAGYRFHAFIISFAKNHYAHARKYIATGVYYAITSFVSKELPGDIDSSLMVRLQSPHVLPELAHVAERTNYLFSLANLVMPLLLDGLQNESFKTDFMLGVAAYQTVTSLVFPEQPNFTRPPDDMAALKVAIEFGQKDGDTLLDMGLDYIDIMDGVPRLKDVTSEVISGHVATKGDQRIALAGTAAMLVAHTKAEEQLVA